MGRPRGGARKIDVSAGAGSVAEDQLPQQPPEPTGTALYRGGLIGRYIVLGLLGKGGMGVVYSAYDPELDRKVALKLLRVVNRRKGDDLDAKRQRLLREAKAIARLSHPSVVVVYDVGTYLDQVFIAMELVDGQTVTRWRELKKPTWREVLRVFIAAGEGIAAAHAANLIHRDLKPDNFMVTRDGKVRVMDFGLARQLDRISDEVPYDEAPPDVEGDTMPGARAAPESRLTHEGNVVGTPAYMPAEQYLGVTDERSDQFSFCVALYEMVYGQHPFEAKTAFGLTGNVQAGRIHDAPARTKVPPWLRKILLRGLRPRPEERFSSMNELLALLRKDPSIARKRWLVAGTVFAVAAGLAFGFQRAADSKRAFCAAGPEKLSGAWELPGGSRSRAGPRHEAIRQAFLATGKSYAPNAVSGVTKLLDDYAMKWVGVYKDSCEATHLRGEQSEELLDLRMSCLNDRLGGLRALTDVFATASGEVVGHAVDAAHALTPLDGCSDAKQLRSLIAPPDMGVKRRVEELRRELAQIKAVHDSGRYGAALDKLKPVVDEARTLGYRPLEAEALGRMGWSLLEMGRNLEGEKALDDALQAALATRHDDLLPEISANLIWATGFEGRYGESDKWMRFASSTIERTNNTQSVAYSWALNNMGVIYQLQGRLVEALEYQQRARDIKEKALGSDDPDVAGSLGNVALALNAIGRSTEALTICNRSIQIHRRAQGDSHPGVADGLSNRGEILYSLGRLTEALTSYQEALAIWQKEFGMDNASVAYAFTGIGRTLTGLGRSAEARPLLEKALSIRQRHDPNDRHLAETEFALAMAVWETKPGSEQAANLARGALERYNRVVGTQKQIAEVTTWLVKHKIAYATTKDKIAR
jgi:tetratricopeptide (TPR) repeat protein/tRNA A-37 threonylcarbamoyl transferase component Bud32